MLKTFLTAESVCMGHPDKLCDFISDSVLDECLSKDKYSRVACEVMATKGNIFVAGEITCSAEVDIQSITENALKTVGYNPQDFKIFVYVHQQSKDIAHGVDNALEYRNGDDSPYSSLGAGDQGSVYGYATNETTQLLPLALVLSHKLCENIDIARKSGVISGLLPDGKAQVSVEYEDGKPKKIKTVVLSVQHEASKDLDTLRKEIADKVLPVVFEEFPLDEDTDIFINPAGQFVEGGPAADTGLTGRKLMVDTYGGLGPHGGGAFSGKDATKVDRSAAYMARHIAKTIVEAKLAERCEVCLSYAIGKASPVAVNVKTFNTSTHSEQDLSEAVQKVFDLRPGAIIEYLDLLLPIYSQTSAYGHFSKTSFSWEKTHKAKELVDLLK